MTDFMKWLYPRYIRPYLDEVPREGYELWFSLLDGELRAAEREDLDRVLGIHRRPRLPAGPAHRGGPAGGHSAINGAICPRTFGVHTAVTAMVSPYSTLSTLASRYS